MGGLALMSRAKKLHAIVMLWIKRLVASSKVYRTGEQHILMIGKLLQTVSTKVISENYNWPRKNLGIVKMIQSANSAKGQSAGLWPNSEIKMIGHGQPSETERMWVFNESLINLRRLKIQSALEGDFKETATPTKLFNLLYKLQYYFRNILFVI
jgi:hypothetical protein